MKTELIVIDSGSYSQLKADVEFIKTHIQKFTDGAGRVSKSNDEWLTPAETRELLGIKRTKYFKMKSEGAFVFTQFGRKAKISRKSLDAFLKGNIV